MPVQNPFAEERVAVRYAAARPSLHDHVAELILARQPTVRRAIDLACGTGLSTTPLRRVAQHVVGADRSPQMLGQAPRLTDVSYVLAAAEHTPFAHETFDLATVSAGIHWFAPEALSELHRIVRSEGTLVVYDVWSKTEMVDAPGFSAWGVDVCAPRYPQLAKNHDNVRALQDKGFLQMWAADHRFEVNLSLRFLVQYLMTHSELIVAIRDGRETEAEQERFLTDGLSGWFERDTERAVVFGIWVRAFRRQPHTS